jgi:transcriptional regulator with XRE-family HTH domain
MENETPSGTETRHPATDDIGTRLREIRIRLGLSQRRLAADSGVANATISQIESGRLNPTVGMLKKILDGVPISLGEFFAAEAAFEERIFFRADDLLQISDGGVSFRQVGANLSRKAIQLLHEQYEPGASTGKHELSHPGEECGIVLSGRLEVTVGARSRVLQAGDAYYFDSTEPHQFKNVGRNPCELISACTPPSF